MATRIAQKFMFGLGVTAAMMEKLPKGVIGRERVTSTQADITTTEVVLSGFTVSPTVVGESTRLLRITAVCHFRPAAGLGAASGPVITGNQQMRLRVRRNSILGDVVARGQGPTPSADVGSTIIAMNTASIGPGEQTFVVTAEGFGLTTWATICSESLPGELLIEDVGPSF